MSSYSLITPTFLSVQDKSKLDMNQEIIINQLVTLSEQNNDVEIVWLYGSRARNSASASSDYDLAIAFKTYIEDPLERRLRPELIALKWQKIIGRKLSVVDIEQASLPLAYTVIEDNCLLYSCNDYKRMTKEQIIMSKWEIDHLYHRKHYA